MSPAVVPGRRGGMTTAVAALGAYIAGLCDLRPFLPDPRGFRRGPPSGTWLNSVPWSAITLPE
jgi:hypothetical protein